MYQDFQRTDDIVSLFIKTVTILSCYLLIVGSVHSAHPVAFVCSSLFPFPLEIHTRLWKPKLPTSDKWRIEKSSSSYTSSLKEVFESNLMLTFGPSEIERRRPFQSRAHFNQYFWPIRAKSERKFPLPSRFSRMMTTVSLWRASSPSNFRSQLNSPISSRTLKLVALLRDMSREFSTCN